MATAPDPLPITRPVLGERERELLLKPLATGWLVQGPYVAAFEQAFCTFTGLPHALAVSSCTAALHLILHALGIGPGDEVIIPSFTYVATANAVRYTGARPVLADVDPATFNLDPAGVEPLVTPRTRAILAVSLFGLAPDWPALSELARRRGLTLLEDAACALGARRAGRHAGQEALAAAFSFHPRKAVTTGEGGMVATCDPALAELVAKLRNHGAEASDLERHQREGGSLLPEFNLLGFNYRMTDLQGALGLAQMERAGEVIAARRAAARVYDRLLADCPHCRIPRVPPEHEHAYQSYVVLYTGGETPGLATLAALNQKRNRLMARMERDGVQVRQGTHAVHTLGYYASTQGYRPGDLPGALMADRLSIALPLFPGIKEADQARVADYLLRPERYL